MRSVKRWAGFFVFVAGGVIAAHSSLRVSAGAGASPIRFSLQPIDFRLETDETPERHAPETMAGGVALFDYNNDGNLDIFFTNGADIRTLKKSDARFRNRLFAGDGKGGFVDKTEESGLAGSGYDVGAAVGDFDNDGCEDLFVAGVYRNTLYRNDCRGHFADVTASAGVESKVDPEFGRLWSVGAVWMDVNNDGLLDLFVVNYLKWDVKTEPVCEYNGRREYCHPKFYGRLPNQLFLNQGGGKFRDISAEAGIRAHPGKGMGAAAADFDLDGRMDIFIANDKLYNSFFRSTGGNRFQEAAFDLNVALRDNAEFISGMGVDFRDLDNDGLADIVVVALDDESFPIFKNTGQGDFEDVTVSSKVAALSLPMAGYSPVISDLDNDGWKDIFVSRGHVQSLNAEPRITVAQHNSVFRNLGGMKFSALTAEAGLAANAPARHRGAAVGDLNHDGLPDVVVTALSAPAEIWMNESGPDSHWLDLRLQGVKSNRDGIGARVKATTAAGPQWNHVSTAAGYASSSAAPLHFGLGREMTADIEIAWPSGVVQTLKGVAGDRVVNVREEAQRDDRPPIRRANPKSPTAAVQR